MGRKGLRQKMSRDKEKKKNAFFIPEPKTSRRWMKWNKDSDLDDGSSWWIGFMIVVVVQLGLVKWEIKIKDNLLRNGVRRIHWKGK